MEKLARDNPGFDLADCVGNRTLVPKRLNIKISSQKPSEYLAKINAKNADFERTLENHLITRDLLNGDLDDEYQFFLDLRVHDIFKIIEEHLMAPTERIKELFYEDQKLDEGGNVSVYATYKNARAEATFNPSSHRIFYKDKVFDSPNAAAIAVKIEFGASEDNTENGWTFWRFQDDNGEERKISEFREKSEETELSRINTLESQRFAEQVLVQEFGHGFAVTGRFRLIYESPDKLVYFQNSNMENVLWYRIDEKALRLLRKSEKEVFIAFASPGRGFVFMIPFKDIVQAVNNCGWNRNHLEVHIDTAMARWKELDWIISAYLRELVHGPAKTDL